MQRERRSDKRELFERSFLRKYPEICNTNCIKSFIYEKKPKSFYADILDLTFIFLSLSDERSGGEDKEGEGSKLFGERDKTAGQVYKKL